MSAKELYSDYLCEIREGSERKKLIEKYKKDNFLYTQDDLRKFKNGITLSQNVQSMASKLKFKYNELIGGAGESLRFVGQNGILTQIKQGVRNPDGTFNIDLRSYDKKSHEFERDDTLHFVCGDNGKEKLMGIYVYDRNKPYSAKYYHTSYPIKSPFRKGGFISHQSTLFENPEVAKQLMKYTVFLDKKSSI